MAEPESIVETLLRDIQQRLGRLEHRMDRGFDTLRHDMRDLREREASRGLDHARLDSNDRSQRDRIEDIERRLDAMESGR